MEMKEHLHNTFVYVTTESALGYKLYFPIHSYCALVFAFWLWMQNMQSWLPKGPPDQEIQTQNFLTVTESVVEWLLMISVVYLKHPYR